MTLRNPCSQINFPFQDRLISPLNDENCLREKLKFLEDQVKRTQVALNASDYMTLTKRELNMLRILYNKNLHKTLQFGDRTRKEQMCNFLVEHQYFCAGKFGRLFEQGDEKKTEVVPDLLIQLASNAQTFAAFVLQQDAPSINKLYLAAVHSGMQESNMKLFFFFYHAYFMLNQNLDSTVLFFKLFQNSMARSELQEWEENKFDKNDSEFIEIE